jgi:hypothetical protein
LNKALKANIKSINSLNNDWKKSTPGIFFKNIQNYESFVIWLKNLNLKRIAYISNIISPLQLPFLAHVYDYPKFIKFKELTDLKDFFFIIPLNSSNNIPLIKFLKYLVQIYPAMLEYVVIIPSEEIRMVEDKILYINFRIDLQKNNKFSL